MIDPPNSPGSSLVTGSPSPGQQPAKDPTKPPEPLERDKTSGKFLTDRETTTSSATASLKTEDTSPEKLITDYRAATLKKESLEHQTYLAREAGNISLMFRNQTLPLLSSRILIIHISGNGEMTNVTPPDQSMQDPKKSAALCKALATTFSSVDTYFTGDKKKQLSSDLKSARDDLNSIRRKLAERGISLPTRTNPPLVSSGLDLDFSNKQKPRIRPDSIPSNPENLPKKPLTYFADRDVHKKPDTLHESTETETTLTPPSPSYLSSDVQKKKRTHKKNSPSSFQQESSLPLTSRPKDKQKKLGKAYKTGRKKIQTTTINPYISSEPLGHIDDRINKIALIRLAASPVDVDVDGTANPLSKIPGINPGIDTSGKQGIVHSARKALLFPVLMNCMKAWQHPEAIRHSTQTIPAYQLGLATATPDTKGVLERNGSTEQQKIIQNTLKDFIEMDSDISTTIATDVSGTNDLFEHTDDPSPLTACLIRDIERLERMRFMPQFEIESLESFNLIKQQLQQKQQWHSKERAVKKQFIDLSLAWLDGLKNQGELVVSCNIKSGGVIVANVIPKVVDDKPLAMTSISTVYTSQKNIMLKNPLLAHFYNANTLPRQ